MGFIEVMDWMAGALQFIVAGYALRLNRLFGSVRVGWSLFWAFLLLALLHLVQAFVPLEVANVSQLQNEVAMSYALISLLLLTSMVHLEKLLKERLKVEQKEQQMVAVLELEVQKKTEWLTRAVEALQTEIDERKRTEKEMQRFQFTTDQAGDGVFWINQDAGFYYVNDEACRSLGYTREELMRLNLFDVDPNQSAEHWKTAWNQAENENVVARQFESLHRRKDGSTFPVEINAKHFSMAGVNLHIAFVRNITERKQAEEKNRQHAILLAEASDAIWGLDLNDRINFWNKGAERIYGWNAAEAVGKTLPELLHQGIVPPKLEACIRAVKERGAWSGELEDVTKDGRTLVIHRRCNAIYDERGQRQSLLMINTDVTEKKRTDAQFLRSQRMESLGTLAGGIAHDLNNILSPLLFSIYLLREKVSDKEGLQLLTTMESSVQRGAQLIKQVLAFGRGIQVERVRFTSSSLSTRWSRSFAKRFPSISVLNSSSPMTSGM
jgi:PAS domain S-box-containing protein